MRSPEVSINRNPVRRAIMAVGSLLGAASPLYPMDAMPVAAQEIHAAAFPENVATVTPPKQPAGSVLQVKIAGVDSKKTVVGNLAVDDPDAAGFLTAYPCDEQRPLQADLNFPKGGATSNRFIGETDATGTVCIYNSVPTHVILDVNGIANDAINTEPRRRDTRDKGESQHPVPAGGTLVIEDASLGKKTVTGNLAVDNPEAAAFLTAYACNEGKPLESDLNYAKGGATSNKLIQATDSSGDLCIFTLKSTDIIVDLNGELESVVNIPGFRYDSRPSLENPFGVRLAAGESRRIKINGIDGVNTIVGNLAVDNQIASGFLTVFDCDTRPNQSDLNFQTGRAYSNRLIAKTNAAGEVCVFASVSTDVILDVDSIDNQITGISPPFRKDTRQTVVTPGSGLSLITGRNGDPAYGTFIKPEDITIACQYSTRTVNPAKYVQVTFKGLDPDSDIYRNNGNSGSVDYELRDYADEYGGFGVEIGYVEADENGVAVLKGQLGGSHLTNDEAKQLVGIIKMYKRPKDGSSLPRSVLPYSEVAINGEICTNLG